MWSQCALFFERLLIIRIETNALLHQNNRGHVILLLDMLAMLLVILYQFLETNRLRFGRIYRVAVDRGHCGNLVWNVGCLLFNQPDLDCIWLGGLNLIRWFASLNQGFGRHHFLGLFLRTALFDKRLLTGLSIIFSLRHSRRAIFIFDCIFCIYIGRTLFLIGIFQRLLGRGCHFFHWFCVCSVGLAWVDR